MLAPVIVLHATLTFLMTGAIWIVQLVHYPLLRFVDRGHYSDFRNKHARKITWIVFLAMCAELFSGMYIFFEWAHPVTAAGIILLFANLGVTALIQAPELAAFSRTFSDKHHRRLVAANWIRTAAWTARSLLLFGLLLDQSW